MRVSTNDLLHLAFEFARVETPMSGLVDVCNTVAIIPRSDEAKTDAMMNHGFILEDSKNFALYNRTMKRLGCVKAKVINLHCKGTSGMLTFADTDYCKVLLKSFTKKYNRANDVFSILYGERDEPLRFITPCGDWWILIAPRIGDSVEPEGSPISLDPFPMEIL